VHKCNNKRQSEIKKFVSEDKKLALLWKRMNNKTKIINNPDNYDAQVFCKSRIIDPLFKNEKNQIEKLSDVDKEWKEKIKKESQPKQYFLKYIE